MRGVSGRGTILIGLSGSGSSKLRIAISVLSTLLISCVGSTPLHVVGLCEPYGVKPNGTKCLYNTPALTFNFTNEDTEVSRIMLHSEDEIDEDISTAAVLVLEHGLYAKCTTELKLMWYTMPHSINVEGEKHCLGTAQCPSIEHCEKINGTTISETNEHNVRLTRHNFCTLVEGEEMCAVKSGGQVCFLYWQNAYAYFLTKKASSGAEERKRRNRIYDVWHCEEGAWETRLLVSVQLLAPDGQPNHISEHYALLADGAREVWPLPLGGSILLTAYHLPTIFTPGDPHIYLMANSTGHVMAMPPTAVPTMLVCLDGDGGVDNLGDGDVQPADLGDCLFIPEARCTTDWVRQRLSYSHFLRHNINYKCSTVNFTIADGEIRGSGLELKFVSPNPSKTPPDLVISSASAAGESGLKAMVEVQLRNVTLLYDKNPTEHSHVIIL